MEEEDYSEFYESFSRSKLESIENDPMASLNEIKWSHYDYDYLSDDEFYEKYGN